MHLLYSLNLLGAKKPYPSNVTHDECKSDTFAGRYVAALIMLMLAQLVAALQQTA
jgi:hypothetical protein